MDGKIFGIPLLLVLCVLFLAVLVDLPMVLLHMTAMQRIDALNAGQASTYFQLQKLDVNATLTPTATPSATITVTPTKAVRAVLKVSSPSGLTK